MPENIWAMPTARDTAPPVRPARLSPTAAPSSGEMRRDQAELGEDRGRDVDGEIVAGSQGGRGDQGHDGDEAFAATAEQDC